jgi:hypothetical protein
VKLWRRLWVSRINTGPMQGEARIHVLTGVSASVLDVTGMKLEHRYVE